MVHATRRAPSNRNAVLRRTLRGTSHIFYPLQGIRGLGDVTCDQDGNCYDTTDPTNVFQTTSAGVPIGTPGDFGTASTVDPYAPPGSATNPSNTQLSALVTSNPAYTGGSTSTSSLVASLAATAAQVAAPIIKAATQQAPYYITNPATGQSVLYNPNTGSTSGTLAASLSTISPMVWLVGIGAIALLAFSGKK
jgi:hypothetical protein